MLWFRRIDSKQGAKVPRPSIKRLSFKSLRNQMSSAVAAVAAQFAQFASAELHAELHAGSNQKMVGACFQPRLTRQPAGSYESYGSYGHTVIRRLGTAPPCCGFSLPSLRSEFRLRHFARKNPSPGRPSAMPSSQHR